MSLFGINSALAEVGSYDPYSIGLVTLGGYSGGALGAAGLGICAISGANAYDLNQAGDTDYYTYCQDTNNKNNYAGFFDGDVYFRDSSLQVHGNLTASNQNLIYGNAASAASGSHLIKLQRGGSTKFRVDRNGNGYFSGSLSAGALSVSSVASAGDVTARNFILNHEASYLDFGGGGQQGQDCKSDNKGMVYYFSRYDVLCVCDGDKWKSLMNDVKDNGYCSNTPYTPT